MMTLLSKGLDDVRFLGIYGMGGIGKTTLSKAIYDRVSHQFEASCFIDGIREESRTTRGLVDLKIELISEILGERDINIRNDHRLSQVIANRLRTKKVFIVLDDVDGKDQLEALAGRHDWFGKGSRIIITSRDCHLLNRYVNDTYEVKVLNDAEALQLFSWKAFKKPHPEENYVELSKDVVSYAQGLPLALEVFGSFLYGRRMDFWISARNLLNKNPNAEILDKLKISFDGLEDLQKQLFLDIACFFNGKHIYSIRHILESLGYYPDINLDVLVDKSLLTISWGKLWMHDLLQKLGQQIVHYESAEEPGKCSRVWRYEDVLHILKNNTGTDAVKGIVLTLDSQIQERLTIEAFSKMTKLKILQIPLARDNALEWCGDPSNFMLSNKLCVMEMWKYPFESFPINFQPDNLVELIMPHSCIKKLWDGRKSFPKLKRIDLSFSKNLVETPDLSGVPNLKKLELEHCTSLSKVHPSIGFLRHLKWLKLQDCKSLERLADEMRSESLEFLYLSGCSRLDKLPDFVGNMTSFWYLNLNGTAIKELSFSSKTLHCLDISNCSRLEKIPKDLISVMELPWEICVAGSGSDLISILMPNSFSSLSSLTKLDFSNCNLSDGAIPNDLCCLSSLYDLNLSGNKFTRIPDIGQLSKLITLDLSHCNLLDGAIPNDLSGISSLMYLDLSGNNFTRLPNTLAQLSCLVSLCLEDCSLLRVLPKLPLELRTLRIKGCPLLKMFYDQLDVWTSNEKFRSTDCSFAATYIDYDGKPSKILYMHPRSPVWIESNDDSQGFRTQVACGPALLGSGIPEWFNDKSTNSSGTIQMHTDWTPLRLMGYALFIVYEFHEPDRNRKKQKVDEHGNSNSRIFDGRNPNFPYFLCQFQANEVDIGKPFVLFDHRVPSVGPSGFWAYIPLIPGRFYRRVFSYILSDERTDWSNLEASITTSSLNVEVKECRARVVREHDASEFDQVLNSISPSGLDLKSGRKPFLDFTYNFLFVDGPISIGSFEKKSEV
ncbi:TMV resistance protein N-like [Alnus glutinosa]|uniref:TMV resistance protein N-like n=1 Tax=Alnus glutinosa TaxID=3517 RepID=UPI002D77768A|nr:TMV resistance protein N-like [Alnus glutinosa]XP_062171853.1 TMV resistance protein N-like [Alnus glutinosa]XP_062171854.1 TMV resistance protein N-like [Alnus glutinosa]XP_062171855.1 TMV resistance protein N-like [Alnus glutinosa]XP_062171856.1 TMV resistance protein N-like [Alnus glutinosa]